MIFLEVYFLIILLSLGFIKNVFISFLRHFLREVGQKIFFDLIVIIDMTIRNLCLFIKGVN